MHGCCAISSVNKIEKLLCTLADNTTHNNGANFRNTAKLAQMGSVGLFTNKGSEKSVVCR